MSIRTRHILVYGAFVFMLQITAGVSSVLAAGMNPPYFVVAAPEHVSKTNKVEVVEVFSYACPHCAEFQPLVDAWLKHVDSKKVEFLYLPAPYDNRDILLARGYFTATVLGVERRTHQGMFDAIHKRGLRPVSFVDVGRIYQELGVPAAQFMKAANDFSVETQIRRTLDLMSRYKVDSTPTLIVAGKYRITADSAGSSVDMLKVADQLIAQELAQSKATSRQDRKSGK